MRMLKTSTKTIKIQNQNTKYNSLNNKSIMKPTKIPKISDDFIYTIKPI
jgi:hypothetical protein